MFRTLHARLIWVLLLLFIPLATAFVWLTLRGSQAYFQELTQEINANLAQQLARDTPSLMIDETLDASVFNDLAMMLALTNPGVDIYVLTREGRIIGASVATKELKRQTVNVSALETFLQQERSFPLLADDPLSDSSRNIFSVASLDQGKGYLYVILTDKSRDSLLRTILTSTVLQLLMWGVGILLILLTAVGIFAFRLLTRRLRQLEFAMTAFRDQDFTVTSPSLLRVARPRDEIDRLQTIFAEMAGRISEQLQGLRRVDTLRRELISNVSHDLRTPLAALRGYLETLQLKATSLSETDKERYLEVASKQSERLSELVSDLFDLSRFDAEAVELSFELFPLQELAQDVVLKFKDYADTKGVLLKLEIGANLPLLKLDLGLMERALTNLLDNAIKHTPVGGEIALELSAAKGGLLLCVRDSGVGIAEKDAEYIFDRYYRASNERGSEGSGLGLAICKRIVEVHGASIYLDKNVKQGSCFCIRFD